MKSMHNNVMNQSLIKSALVAILFSIVIASCDQPANKEASNKFDRIDSLRSEFLQIQDSLLYSWNVMIKDDNEKISSLSRLLDEVKYAGVSDTSTIVEYKERLEKLKKSRYSYTSMANSMLIDEYDLASNTLVNEIISYAQSHPEFERYAVMQKMIDETMAAESRILFFRIDYDDYVKIYNRFLKNHEGIIDEIDKEHEHVKLSLFELAPLEE